MEKYPDNVKIKRRWKKWIVAIFIALFAVTGCSGELFESLTTEAVPEKIEETAKDVTLQDSLFSESIYAQGGSSVQITAAGDASYEVWFAPEGTSSFVAGPTMTMTSGDSSVITAPADEGEYRLYIVYPDGTVSAPSLAVLTVDNMSPAVTIDVLRTNDQTPELSGTVTDTTASINVNIDGADYSAVNNGDGTWSLGGDSLTDLGEGVYSVVVTATDPAGNAGVDSTIDEVTVDLTDPVISSVSPTVGAGVNSTLVSYTLSEICDSGMISWERTGGSADGGSPHEQVLTGAELNAGAHNNIVITNNPTLVDGAEYTISWDCTDRAGNTASTVSSSGVTYSDSNPEIVSAETMDTDNDGKIDTYRIAFNKSIDDSTFPGFSLNSEGSVTNEWLVAGYTNIRLIHGAAVTFAADMADDAIVYLRFDESPVTCDAGDQSGCDTGAKPDLTTTPSPGVEDSSGNTLDQVASGDVTEADGARPLLITAKSLNKTAVDVIFTEAMEETTAETASYYTINNGLTVSNAERDSGNYKTVHLTTTNQTGGTTYTLTVNTDVKDLSNYNLDSGHNTATFDGNVKPIVQSITTVNATTLTITFNEAVTAASAECINLSACGNIYSNSSLPVKEAVSTGGPGVNSATFTLTVNEMVEGQNYTTAVLENTVTSVASGQKMGNTDNSATFLGDGKPGATISVDTETECPGNGADRVVVQYDQAVDSSATTPGNYIISLCVTGDCLSGSGSPNNSGASAITDLGGNKYAVDFGDTFDTDTSRYRLAIQDVQDSSGNSVASPTNLEFRCGTDTTPPVLTGADVITANSSATQVMMTFSEGVDSVTANTSGNYKYDSESYGSNVNSAARQSNISQVLVIFEPGLSEGGHQVRVQNVKDLAATPNTLVDDGVNNVQPIIVNAPDSLGDGSVFEDPFGDGTKAAFIVKYDGKLYLGADSNSAKLFETDYGLTTSQKILMDADGTPGDPIEDFYGYLADYAGCASPPCGDPVWGVDTLYAACIGGTSTPSMTGDECATEGGNEMLFVGSFNTDAIYRAYWATSDKSSSATTFTFTEGLIPDSTSGTQAFRSTVFVVYKDYLWNHFGAEGGGGGRGGRVCMNTNDCADTGTYGSGIGLTGMYEVARIGNSGKAAGGGDKMNGSKPNVFGSPYLNAINILYEYDADAESGNDDCSGTDCDSQLYVANGGVYTSTYGNLGSARGTYSDGGIVRSSLKYSKKDSLPGNCSAPCMAADDYDTDAGDYWVDVTPDGNTDWNNYVSIPLPESSTITNSGDPDADCSGGNIEMDCVSPYNTFVPAMKAVPYMRKAPNGDLYMIRNACSAQTVCRNGYADCDFRTVKQVCPPESEVTQLWMLPGCESSSSCPAAANEWVLVAESPAVTLGGTVSVTASGDVVTGSGTSFTSEVGPGDIITINGEEKRVSSISSDTSMTMDGNFASSASGVSATINNDVTNMAGNTGGCGTSPNKCLKNTHFSLLEFVGDYIYVGFDNSAYGANVWRADMGGVASGSTPAESSFEMVNIPGLDGTATNQKIFSHITVNDAGTDWLIITTRDGNDAVQIYRTANDQD